MKLTHAQARFHRLGVSLAVLAFGGVLAAAIGAGVVGAAPAKTVVLGAGPKAKPSCPSTPCQAVGKVTGYQTTIEGKKKPFVAPGNGTITAWSIKLSAPDQTQTDFFNKFYGGPPKAQIVILRPAPGATSTQTPPDQGTTPSATPTLRVRSASPPMDLSSVLGKVRTFTLKPPLPIKKGQIVGLGVPTWAPAFGIGLPNTNSWVGSRAAGKCEAEADIQAGTAHVQPGTDRAYGCTYRTARLLYSARFKPGTAKKKPAAQQKPPA